MSQDLNDNPGVPQNVELEDSLILGLSARQNRQTIERAFNLGKAGLSPPRGLRLNGFTLIWDAPADPRGITHYLIYVDDDAVVVRQISAQQRQCSDPLVGRRFYVASFNAYTGHSSSRSLFDAGSVITLSNATPTPPAQPAAGDWSVAVAGYTQDPITGKRSAHLQATITINPASVDHFAAFAYAGVTPPSDPSLYTKVALQPKAASGSTILDWYIDRPSVNTVYQIVVTASTPSFEALPSNVVTSAPKAVTVTAIPLPAQVTGFSVTALIDTPSQSGRIQYTFTPPADPEFYTANIYSILTDNTYTPLGGEIWKLAKSTPISYTETLIESFSLGADTYRQFRSFSANKYGLENTSGAPTSNLHIPAYNPGSIPTQPASGDFSASVLSYGFDSTLQRGVATLQVIVTINPVDVSYFSVWMFKGGSPPTDPSQWLSYGNFPKAASGNTTCYVGPVNRESSNVVYQVAVTGSSGATIVPTLASPVHSVTITSPSLPSQPTGFSVVLHTSPAEAGPGTTGGPPSGQFEYIFTPPVDQNYFSTKVYRVFTDSSGTPLAGQGYELVSNPDKTFRQPDWWALGSDTYCVFKIQCISRQIDPATGKNFENTASPPTFGPLHIPATSGLYDAPASTGGFKASNGGVAYAYLNVVGTYSGHLSLISSAGGSVSADASGARIQVNDNGAVNLTRHNATGITMTGPGVGLTINGNPVLDNNSALLIPSGIVGPTGAAINTLAVFGNGTQVALQGNYSGGNTAAGAIAGISGASGDGVYGVTSEATGASAGGHFGNSGGGLALLTTGRCKHVSLPTYANNAAAIGGGLGTGELYRVTGSNPMQLAVVF